MKRKKLEHYLDKEWQLAINGLESFVREGKGKALHRFRVQVKKIKALIQLLTYKRKKSRIKKAFKPLRCLFQQAGKIRDAQLLLDLGGAHHAAGTLLHEQKQAMAAAAHDLRSKAKTSLRQVKKSRCKLLRQLTKMHQHRIRIFYQDQLRIITEELSGKGAAGRLHNCRKQIKALLYNDKLVHKALDVRLNRPYLKTLEKAIGSWHDHQLVARRLPALKARSRGLLKHALLLSAAFADRAATKR
ncbi:CHAD domain-containing protein [Taibaiella helva]|uniref:CHAD domain-containing protein n=1 Tax=Taibaiella helva TaxID=2301235 RepID=UPI00130051B4|nr:CHAD domain-containing protein [Taibaiella helva]